MTVLKKGLDFIVPNKGNYHQDEAIVLKIEQWDDTRVDPKSICGDKIWTNWSSNRAFRFNYNGKFDIQLARKSQVFPDAFGLDVHIRVGDRVSRGIFWKDEYNNDDGGKGGTVCAISYRLKVAGVIARVRWHKNNHLNQYSWGFKDQYDLECVNI